MIIVLTFASTGCDENEKSADFEIVNISTGMTSYDCPYIEITVKNTGNKTGYNVSCDVKAISGSTIIDTGFAYFANGADIGAGMSAVDDAIFFDLSSHGDYDRIEYDLDWLEH